MNTGPHLCLQKLNHNVSVIARLFVKIHKSVVSNCKLFADTMHKLLVWTQATHLEYLC